MISISRASICLSRKFILSMSCFNWKEKASCATVLDTNDNTVQAEMDAAFRTHDVGEFCLELMGRCVDICDKAYPDFMKALWA